MIKFRCSKCNQKIGVGDEYIGRKIRCPKCDLVQQVSQQESEFINPLLNSNVERQQSSYIGIGRPKSSQTLLGLPKVITVLIGVSLLCIILVFAGWMLFRDTWEIDNLSKINQMIIEVREQCSLETYNTGIQKYEELCVFIGKRELKHERQRLDYIDIQEKYESLKERMQAEKKRQAELVRLEMEKKIAEEKAKQDAEIARKKQIEEKEKAEAQRIEAEKAAKIARELEIQEKRRQKEAAAEAQQLAKEQEKERLDEERISNGYLNYTEMVNSLISTLVKNGTLVKADFATAGISTYQLPNESPVDRADICYYVEYWTQGGLFRRGQCNIALDAVSLPDDVQRKYNIRNTWKIIYVYVDGANIWGFN